MKRGNEKLLNIVLLKQTLLHDHAVSNWWSTLHTQGDINDDKISADLLNLLLTDYINLRGFAFAARWMEMYKTENKKVIDKTKGLRKNYRRANLYYYYGFYSFMVYTYAGVHESQGAYNSYMKAVSTFVERKYLR